MSDFWIRQGDTAPALEAVLQDDDGNAVDVSNATAVQFHMADKQHNELVNASGTVKDGANGIVAYAWSDGDTDEVGEHLAEFQVTYQDGSVETFPNREYIRIRIERELA